MRFICRLGFHRRGVSSHHLGQPWVWNMHCWRCGKTWRELVWLPPQRPRTIPDNGGAPAGFG